MYSFRTFSLPCSGGVCKSQILPSCPKPLEWKKSEVIYHQCQETAFNGDTLYCSPNNGTKEVRLTSEVGGGVLEDVAISPCLDCTHLLTWSAWEPCSSQSTSNPLRNVTGLCRRRGDDTFGFEQEEKEGLKGIVHQQKFLYFVFWRVMRYGIAHCLWRFYLKSKM